MIRIPLIQGTFPKTEALDLMTELIKVKIKHHERMIDTSEYEEDIKFRENCIKDLQEQLHLIRTNLLLDQQILKLDSEIVITAHAKEGAVMDK